MSEHVSDSALQTLAEGTISDTEASEFVRHLVQCPSCGERFEGLLRADTASSESSSFPADRLEHLLRDRVAERLVANAQAETTAKELAALAPLRRQTWVRNRSTARTPLVAEQLVRIARSTIFDDPKESLSLASMAVEIAEGVAADPSEKAELLALCWTELANARRVLGDISGAWLAVRRAEAGLAEGTGTPSLEARYLEILSVLQWESRDYETALRTNSRFARISRELHQKHDLGRAMSMKANILGSMGRLEESLVVAGQATQLLDPAKDANAYYAAHHNIALSLEKLGRADEAIALLERAHLLPGAQSRTIRVWFVWLQARLQRRQGRPAAAETAFSAAVSGFLDVGKVLTAAEAALELATLLFEARRFSEVRELAARTLPIFKSQGIHREALAAYTLFVQAAEAETLTQALLAELTQYFGQFKPREARPFRPTGSAG